MEINVDINKLRNYMVDYVGTAAFGGLPAAAVDAWDIENMDDYELCQKAEELGIDLRRFEA